MRRGWYNRSGRTCQGYKLVVFQLAVKQLITEGRSWILLCLKEMKVQIVPVCADFSSGIVYARKLIFEAQERLCSLALSAHPLFEQTLNRKKWLTCLLWSMPQGRLDFRWNLNDLNGPKWSWWSAASEGGGGVLPYISYIGMCRPIAYLACVAGAWK